MKTKAYQNDLIQMISEQTGQNREIIAAYIATHFDEIEKLLNKTSSAKVDGLGVFRVMKTSSKSKVLFIPGFDELDEVKQNIYRARMAESAVSASTLNDDFDFIVQSENQVEEKSSSSSYISSDDLSQRNATETSSDPYSTWDDFYSKSKKKYNWGTAVFLIIAVALIGIIIATVF